MRYLRAGQFGHLLAELHKMREAAKMMAIVGLGGAMPIIAISYVCENWRLGENER